MSEPRLPDADGHPADRLHVIEGGIARATRALLRLKKPDGHFCFELEADCTITSEYVLMRQFRGEPDDLELERKIAVYLRRIQCGHGGWSLVKDGAFDMSASVKAYYALKMIGDDIDAPHMRRACGAILEHGGASRTNVFTRFMLAEFEQVPWSAPPCMPVEMMLLPAWFPFHINKMSYWARTVLVPLLVIGALRPTAKNPRGVAIRELFVVPPEEVKRWPRGAHQTSAWAPVFHGIDRVLKAVEPFFPRGPRKRAIGKAVAFIDERLNGEDGLGAIYPAMSGSLLMYDVLGYPPDHPNVLTARGAVEKLVTEKADEAYVQPCLSPVWDTALVAHALLEVGTPEAERAAAEGLNWLTPRQVLDVRGEWAERRPHVRPGGWAFQYNNAHYPDLDDTAVVIMAMDRGRAKLAGSGAVTLDEPIARGREWVEGLQSKNGGWGAFEVDNDFGYMNHIPFADHGALLDPPTADVTARCVSMIAQFGETADTSRVLARGLENLLADQEGDGSWFGRWGMNYIYGTWSVLCALNAAGLPHDHPSIRRAVAWLLSIQNEDDGWGEDGDSYKLDYSAYERAPSTPSQTSWALLALMAAGEAEHPAVESGVAYLMANQAEDGLWPEESFTATGFPRVFYLRYHGYAKFFPLWTLARYRNLKQGNSRVVSHGM